MEIWESNDLRKVEMYFVECLCLQGQSALFIEQSKQSVAKFEDDKQRIFSESGLEQVEPAKNKSEHHSS